MKRILFLFFSTSFDLGPALAPSFAQLSDPSSQGTRFLQKPTVVSYCDKGDVTLSLPRMPQPVTREAGGNRP